MKLKSERKINNIMPNLNKKDIILFIKKFGQRAGGPEPPKPKPAPPPPPPNQIYYMQQAIVDLAKSFQLEQNRSFNDFIVQNYSQESAIKGVELKEKEYPKKMETSLPTDLYELKVMADNFHYIGSSQPSKNHLGQPDGYWDWRTQNALKNTYAFANGLILVAEDFGTRYLRDNFTRSDLIDFSNEIPNISEREFDNKIKTFKQDDLIKRAEVLTPLIDKLRKFYTSFCSTILRNPKFKPYVTEVSADTGSRPQLKFDIVLKPKATDTAPPAAATVSNQKIDWIPLTQADNKKKYLDLPLDVLTSKDKLQNFMMNELGYSSGEVSQPYMQLKVIKEIKSIIDARRSSGSL